MDPETFVTVSLLGILESNDHIFKSHIYSPKASNTEIAI